MCFRVLAWVVTAALLCAQGALAQTEHSGPHDELGEALALVKSQKYAQAIPLLRATLASAEFQTEKVRKEVALLLGICLFREHDFRSAEPLLREAAQSTEPKTRDSARIFLGLLLDEQDAFGEAQTQLGKVSGSQTFGGAAQTLLSRRRPNRILVSLLVAPEYDGNVRLTDTANWYVKPDSSSDGDVLFLASLGFRPFSFPLTFGNAISYRQQLTLRDYSLLLNSTWLGYSYAGSRHRFRVHGSMNFAWLGGSYLFWDVLGQLNYRLRIHSELGVALKYDVRQRSFAPAEYQSFSGQIHDGLVEVSYGTSPKPVLFGMGYELLREHLAPPLSPLSPIDDYRAWAHGAKLRLQVRLHKRVEWSLQAQYLRRQFDYIPGPEETGAEGSPRQDHFFSTETTFSIRFAEYFEAFFGASFTVNDSNWAVFSYQKPTAFAGLSTHFGFL